MRGRYKAVIMAGGEGTRLFPLTERMPKPLAPILNVPAMSHILRLLSAHGITEAAVTLKYRAHDVMEYYKTHDTAGVRLCFFIEEEPLGTAGGVRAASDFLDSDFLVISGDAVCDFPLSEAIEFHEERCAAATIVTARCHIPLAFGGVVCCGDGAVSRFVEKPSWREVLTDRVNTGIYVFSRQILSEIPEGVFCDFSRDVFPKLIGHGLYAYAADGYWCDVGSLDAYYGCNLDALRGKIRGLCRPSAGGRYISDEAVLLSGACVLGDSVVGAARIGSGAVVDASIVMDGAVIGAGAVVRSSIVCRNAVVGKHAVIKKGAVIGDSCVIENGAVVESGVKISAGQIILSEDIMVENRIFSGIQEGVFREFGLAGNVKTELTPSFLTRYGAAIVQTMGRKAVFFNDGTPSADYVKSLILAGAVSAGAVCTDGGEGFLPLAAFSVSHSGSDFGIYVKNMGGDIHKIYVLDIYGFPLGTPRSRRLASAMKKEYDVTLPSVSAAEDDFYGDYLHYLVDNAKPLRGKLAVSDSPLGQALYAAVSLLGGICETGTKSMAADGFVFADISDDGELEISYRTAEGGYVMIDRWHAAAALIKSKIAGGENVIYLPVTAPHALADTVRTLGGIVKQYDTETDGGETEIAAAAGQTWLNDPLLLALLFAAELGERRTLLYAGEEFALAEKSIDVESAASVIGELASHGADVENGVLVLNFNDASVRVTAQDEHTVKLSAEARSPRDAEDALRYAEKGILETADM